jgi:glycosyltransferase involved in cell wall biosynthesis
MRVCHICSNYDNFFVNLMEEQMSKGIDLRVFYFRAKERGWPDVNSSYVDVRLNYSKWHRPFFYLKERSVLEDFFDLYKNKNFEIIHAHTLFSNGYVALQAKKKWGTPYIVAIRDMDVNIFLKYRLTLRKLGIEIMNEASRIIFLSSSYRDYVISNYVPNNLKNIFIEKSLIIPNGVDPYFLENKRSKTSLDKKKSLKIITVGHVSKRKNQLTVCESVESLIKSGFNVEYTIVGKILDEKVFEKMKQYPFIKYVPFLPKEKLIEEYRKSDIFVMPSLTETFGLTYVEAMTQGLPIIYSNGQGFDGYFEEGKVGYSVDSKSVNDISSRIVDIINNYNRISENCVSSVDRFNWVDISREYVQQYSQLLRIKEVY